MTDELTPTEGMNRREMLKRSALVGGAGALMWAAPSVTTFSNPAFGQTEGTPEGNKDFSYIALRYECNGVTKAVKFEFDNVNQTPKCTTAGGNPIKLNTPQCSFDLTGVQSTPASDCNLFTFSYPLGNLTAITITMVHGSGCLLTGVGVGKCGNPENPQSGGECVEVTAPAGGSSSLTFQLCGT